MKYLQINLQFHLKYIYMICMYISYSVISFFLHSIIDLFLFAVNWILHRIYVYTYNVSIMEKTFLWHDDEFVTCKINADAADACLDAVDAVTAVVTVTGRSKVKLVFFYIFCSIQVSA